MIHNVIVTTNYNQIRDILYNSCSVNDFSLYIFWTLGLFQLYIFFIDRPISRSASNTYRGTGQLQHHPPIFFQNSWDFCFIRSVYLCSDSMLNLTCNFNSVTKIFENFFQQPFLKVDFLKWLPLSWLLNLAPSTICLIWRKIMKLFCAVLWTETKTNWALCYNYILV